MFGSVFIFPFSCAPRESSFSPAFSLVFSLSRFLRPNEGKNAGGARGEIIRCRAQSVHQERQQYKAHVTARVSSASPPFARIRVVINLTTARPLTSSLPERARFPLRMGTSVSLCLLFCPLPFLSLPASTTVFVSVFLYQELSDGKLTLLFARGSRP